MEPISLEGIRMNVIETAANGVVNKDTIFLFTQNGDVITAEYAGGRIRRGFLVGKIGDEKVQFSYCQLQIDGQLDHGDSLCEVGKTPEGKITLTEHFTWGSRNEEKGVNVFQEL
jgi:hypothetical protein